MESGKSDEVKGRVKEASGVLSGDEEMEREGKTDQSAGKLKQAAGKIKKKADATIEKVRAALR